MDVADITWKRAAFHDRGESAAEVELRILTEEQQLIDQLKHWRGHYAIRDLEIFGSPSEEVRFTVHVSDPIAAKFQTSPLEEKTHGLQHYFKSVEVQIQTAG